MYHMQFTRKVINAVCHGGRWLCRSRLNSHHRAMRAFAVIPHSGALAPSGFDRFGRRVLRCRAPGCQSRVHLP